MTPQDYIERAIATIGSQGKTARLLGVSRETVRLWQRNGMSNARLCCGLALSNLSGIPVENFGVPLDTACPHCEHRGHRDVDGCCVACGRHPKMGGGA